MSAQQPEHPGQSQPPPRPPQPSPWQATTLPLRLNSDGLYDFPAWDAQFPQPPTRAHQIAPLPRLEPEWQKHMADPGPPYIPHIGDYVKVYVVAERGDGGDNSSDNGSNDTLEEIHLCLCAPDPGTDPYSVPIVGPSGALLNPRGAGAEGTAAASSSRTPSIYPPHTAAAIISSARAALVAAGRPVPLRFRLYLDRHARDAYSRWERLRERQARGKDGQTTQLQGNARAVWELYQRQRRQTLEGGVFMQGRQVAPRVFADTLFLATAAAAAAAGGGSDAASAAAGKNSGTAAAPLPCADGNFSGLLDGFFTGPYWDGHRPHVLPAGRIDCAPWVMDFGPATMQRHATAVLDSPELLMLYAQSMGDSLAAVRYHFARIACGYGDQLPDQVLTRPLLRPGASRQDDSDSGEDEEGGRRRGRDASVL